MSTSVESKVQIRWYDEQKKLILQTFKRKWKLQDYIESLPRTYELLDSVTHPVYLISVFEGNFILPDGFIEKAVSTASNVRSNERLHVIVFTQKTGERIRAKIEELRGIATGSAYRDRERIQYCFSIKEAFSIINKHQTAETQEMFAPSQEMLAREEEDLNSNEPPYDMNLD